MEISRRSFSTRNEGLMDTAGENIEVALNSSSYDWKNWKLCSYEMLPKWMQDNHYIHDGYRPPLGSMQGCLYSIFRLHTETGNIWTHLIGCTLFIMLWVSQIRKLNHWTDRLIFSAFFVGAIICLGLSTLYHTCSCHSEAIARICHKLDYCGISMLILGSFIPTIYYGFYNNFAMKCAYLVVISSLSVLAVIVSLYDMFGLPQFRPLRAAVFLTSGLSGIVPGIHWVITIEPDLMYSWYCLVSQGALYVIGALLYALRVPERFFPGSCNFYFQSHQFFHILVVCAAIVHLMGLQFLINYRLKTNLNILPT